MDIPPAQVTLTLSINGGAPVKTVWKHGGQANPELKSIRVFDSEPAFHYIPKSERVEYKPEETKVLMSYVMRAN